MLLLFTVTAIAQPGERTRKMPSPEVQAKKMTLALDLSEKQESQVLKLLTENQSQMQKNRPSREEVRKMSDEEKEDLKVTAMDQKIAMKRNMKNILNAKQYDRLEKIMAKRVKGKMKRKRKR